MPTLPPIEVPGGLETIPEEPGTTGGGGPGPDGDVATSPYLQSSLTPLTAGLTGAPLLDRLNTNIAEAGNFGKWAGAWCELLTAYLGNGAVTGGTLSAGTGLSVAFTALSAFVNTPVALDAGTVGGLTDNAMNYLFLRQDGTWTVNTTGTDPLTTDSHGASLLWGTAAASGGAVATVTNERQVALNGVRAAVHRRVSIALSDANRTLTTVEAENRILEFTGALTAGRDIILPATDGREWIVYNGTTGGFALTFKTNGGSGVAVAATKRAIVYGDGVNVVRAGADV
jgi:hypothetical protein